MLVNQKALGLAVVVVVHSFSVCVIVFSLRFNDSATFNVFVRHSV